MLLNGTYFCFAFIMCTFYLFTSVVAASAALDIVVARELLVA